MLEKIKELRGINGTGKDAVLNFLIEDCKAEAMDYCNLAEYNEKLDRIVVQMVIERYNRMGNEGVKSVSYSSASETYADDYSDKIYKSLNKFRRLRVLC